MGLVLFVSLSCEMKISNFVGNLEAVQFNSRIVSSDRELNKDEIPRIWRV